MRIFHAKERALSEICTPCLVFTYRGRSTSSKRGAGQETLGIASDLFERGLLTLMCFVAAAFGGLHMLIHHPVEVLSRNLPSKLLWNFTSFFRAIPVGRKKTSSIVLWAEISLRVENIFRIWRFCFKWPIFSRNVVAYSICMEECSDGDHTSLKQW